MDEEQAGEELRGREERRVGGEEKRRREGKEGRRGVEE